MTSHPTPTLSDVAAELAGILDTPPPADVASPEYADWATTRLAFSAALLEVAFSRSGWQSAHVGGGVLQFHLGGEGYQTGDLDMVVAQSTGLPVPRAALDDVMRRMGARPNGARHWILGSSGGDLLVEVPNSDLPRDTDRVQLPGDLVLTMDSVEHVIAGRIIEFHNTGNADHALQAIHALRALGDRLDRDRFERCIAEEGVTQARDIISALVVRPAPVTADLVRYAHDMLRGKQQWCDLRDPRCGPTGRRL